MEPLWRSFAAHYVASSPSERAVEGKVTDLFSCNFSVLMSEVWALRSRYAVLSSSYLYIKGLKNDSVIGWWQHEHQAITASHATRWPSLCSWHLNNGHKSRFMLEKSRYMKTFSLFMRSRGHTFLERWQENQPTHPPLVHVTCAITRNRAPASGENMAITSTGLHRPQWLLCKVTISISNSYTRKHCSRDNNIVFVVQYFWYHHEWHAYITSTFSRTRAHAWIMKKFGFCLFGKVFFYYGIVILHRDLILLTM